MNGTEQTACISYGMYHLYGRDRVHVTVWLNKEPQAEFLEADDFATSRELLTEIRLPGEKNLRMCRFPDEPIPEQYSRFRVVGLPTRVHAKGVRSAWAVVTTLEDHKTVLALAALRQMARNSQGGQTPGLP
jgi:hypothetical protein